MKDGGLELDPAVFAEIAARFRYPAYERLEDSPPALAQARRADRRFDAWMDNAVANHKVPGYAIVTLSLKPQGGTPGYATAEQMQAIADLAERYSYGEIRVGHEQNLVLPHVAQHELAALWRALDELGLATPNVGLVSDIIACPGLDYCSLANARSKWRSRLPAASAISTSRAISAGCTSTFPAASTPAAIITSATSAFSASRRTTRSFIRSLSVGAPTRKPGSAR